MKKFINILGGILLGLLAAGVVLLSSRPPRGGAILLNPPPTALPIVVHVTGAVANPGVYRVPQGSRVEDVIEKAGGVVDQADLERINLASSLQDGQQVHVPDQEDQSRLPHLGSQTDSQPGGEAELFPININTASREELERLPGVGPVTAGKIIAYREETPFERIEDIQKVSGIGPATFEKLRDLIFVETQAEKKDIN